MLRKERQSTTLTETGGGFVGDEQGLGKTAGAIGLCIVERLLSKAHEEVRIARMANEKTHLPKSTQDKPQHDDSMCPSEEAGVPAFSICCPSKEYGPSARLIPKQGPTLIM